MFLKIASYLLVGFVLFGVTGAIVVGNLARNPEFFSKRWKLQREVPLEVKMEPVQRANIIHTIEAPGEVEADVEVEISAQVVSRIEQLPFREGDPVQPGELLVQLDSIDYQAQVHSAEAAIKRLESSILVMEADLAKSLRDLEKSQRLFQAKAISSTEVADLETLVAKDRARMAMARAELAEAQAMLIKAKEDLADTTIRSPIGGIISQLKAEVGEVVMVGTMNNAGTVIMTVSDPNTMVVRAEIDETDVPLVKEGQPAFIHLQYDERTLQGKVLRISPKGVKANAGLTAANPDEVATFETIISIDSPPPDVRLGMTANVEIQVDDRSGVLSIPSQAVLHRRAKDLPAELAKRLAEDSGVRGAGEQDPTKRYHQVVFVAHEGHAQCRLVRTGVSDDRHVEIVQGLQLGEMVISGPYRIFDKLKQGVPVTAMPD